MPAMQLSHVILMAPDPSGATPHGPSPPSLIPCLASPPKSFRWIRVKIRIVITGLVVKMVTGYEENSEISEFLRRGMESLAEIVQHREQNKAHSIKFISAPRSTAHLVLQSTLLSMMSDHSGKFIADPSQDTLYQMALLTNLVALIDPTYEMLLSGLYGGSGALIRQSYEMNARLAEIQQGTNWASGKTPNVGHLPLEASRFYGELSEVSHFSKPELGALTEVEIQPDIRAQSLSPVVREESLLRLLDLQLLSMVLTLGYQMTFFQNVFKGDLEQYAKLGCAALSFLQEAGVLQRK